MNSFEINDVVLYCNKKAVVCKTSWVTRKKKTFELVFVQFEGESWMSPGRSPEDFVKLNEKGEANLTSPHPLAHDVFHRTYPKFYAI